jgi:Zn-dependent membrane protease YugP
MQRSIGKVTDLSSMLQAFDFFANFIIFGLVALTVELEAAKKVLSEVKIALLAEEKAT